MNGDTRAIDYTIEAWHDNCAPSTLAVTQTLCNESRRILNTTNAYAQHYGVVVNPRDVHQALQDTAGQELPVRREALVNVTQTFQCERRCRIDIELRQQEREATVHSPANDQVLTMRQIEAGERFNGNHM